MPTATLPAGCGMNYNLEYDPHHRVLLLVTGTYGQPTTVWALRVEPGSLREAASGPTLTEGVTKVGEQYVVSSTRANPSRPPAPATGSCT